MFYVCLFLNKFVLFSNILLAKGKFNIWDKWTIPETKPSGYIIIQYFTEHEFVNNCFSTITRRHVIIGEKMRKTMV